MSEKVESGKKPKFLVVRGAHFSPSFNPKHIEEALDYKAQDDDVFIVTYPKCGTTWMQQICYLIYSGGVPPESNEVLRKQAVFFEHDGLEAVKAIVKPGTIKYHLPRRLTPHNPNAKYIVVVRNPKDACVSFYYHTIRTRPHLGKSPYDFNGSFSEYFKFWLSGEVECGDYFDFTLSWWRHREDPNVLLVVYEDIKKDPRKEVLKVARFLGSYERALLADEGFLDNVLKFSGVDFMKELINTGHIRKGVVGDWRNHFTEEESEKVNERIREDFGGTGLDELWQEELKF